MVPSVAVSAESLARDSPPICIVVVRGGVGILASLALPPGRHTAPVGAVGRWPARSAAQDQLAALGTRPDQGDVPASAVSVGPSVRGRGGNCVTPAAVGHAAGGS